MELTDGPSTDAQLAQVREEVLRAGSPDAVNLAVMKGRALAELRELEHEGKAPSQPTGFAPPSGNTGGK